MDDKTISIYYETLSQVHKELEKIKSIDLHLKNIKEHISFARGADQKIIDSLKGIQLRTEETLQQLKRINSFPEPNSQGTSNNYSQQVEALQSINFPQRFEVVNRNLEATGQLLKTSLSTQEKLVNQNVLIDNQLSQIQRKLEFLETRLQNAEKTSASQQPDLRPYLESVFASLNRYFDKTNRQFNDFEEHVFYLVKNFRESVDLRLHINIVVTVIFGLLLFITLLLRT
jgi:hypothetical protein